MARRHRDSEFSADLRTAARRGPRTSANILLFVVAGFFAAAILWASRATVDEVTTGQGRIIPSGEVQIVQNLEGGLVAEILVREGDVVQLDQILVRIDDTGFASSYRENRARYLALLATVARLSAEVDGGRPSFPPELNERPETVADERALFAARRAELDSSLAVLNLQTDQRRQELVEIANRVARLGESLALAKQELDIIKPMVERGVTSRIELLRLQREVTDLEREREAAQLSIPRSRSALAETQRRIEEKIAGARSLAQAELSQARVRLDVLKEALAAVEDRVVRTEVRSPVYGTVKQVLVNTIGGVITPGMDLVEIVPLEDNLLVEAQIRPADIAFLHPGQRAKVKITAYDFATYGALDGTLEQISVDAIVDDQQQSFFRIRVRTERSFLGDADAPLPIIPGMVAQVDILTGKRTVLDYLLKPIKRTRERALRER
jgi:adhesin transport system membrane fusion protein